MAITTPILNLFARSPIRPLQEHVDTVTACAKALVPFFEAVLSQNWEQALIHQKEIDTLESKADQIKRDLRLHLPKGLFLPVPRSDILEILTVQDRIANKAEDIAGLILGRRMIIPKEFSAEYMALLNRCIDAAKQARKAINELDELLETGFRGNEARLVEDMIHKLDQIEHDTDEMQVAIRHQLFKLENKLPPIDVIFLYKVIEWTGEIANHAQGVGGRLELLLAR
ncbi:MAG: TIGR00153 family protein [Proteobacteria bacterium]|nr:TIGR00153 family protein [Pseudomonadota bacterium]